MEKMGDDDCRSYDDAVAALYSPLHQASSKEALQKAASRRTNTVKDMREYLNRMALSALPPNMVHITGTKGKGSTACMCEAILRERYNLMTGLFTSPHLVDIRERIRVCGKPISQRVFSEAYWEVRRRLEAYNGDDNQELPILPGYFRMLMLMALYVFGHYEPQIDVMIMEVGMGGRYDATNIIDMDDSNVVCGVTLLDLDHTRVLGDTIEQIAWEKGGIFQVNKGSGDVSKRPTSVDDDACAPTTERSSRDSAKRLFALDTNCALALSVLRECAAIEGRGKELFLVSEGDSIPADLEIGLKGDHQRINAELAIALCEALMDGAAGLHEDRGCNDMHRALENVCWPGRCQTVALKADDGTPLNLRLDGAHTKKSLEVCLKWLISVSDGSGAVKIHRVLIFNCSHERDPVQLLELLAGTRADSPAVQFDTVYFCRADFERPSSVSKPTASQLLHRRGASVDVDINKEITAITWQETLAQVWSHLVSLRSDDAHFNTVTNMNVHEAIAQIRGFRGYDLVEVFVTGSLYIVGSVLDSVSWEEDAASGLLMTSFD